MTKKEDLKKLGSDTAKGGFRNEDDVVRKFNNWQNDADAQKWLVIMGYPLKEIEEVKAVKLRGYKTDVQVKITIIMKKAIAAENLSIKLVTTPSGFNQVDKRRVDKYVSMWSIPPNIARHLKLFTGEIRPSICSPRDSRRVFLDEMDAAIQEEIVDFFRRNKLLIVSDILKGDGLFSVGWMLVIIKCKGKSKWVLKTINRAMNFFGGGDVGITKRGSLHIGRILMQRKGGDAGRDTAKMLQFKINPAELFGC
ncbi:MAG: type II restriction endonuclease [Candidatus Omnitrophica bacterium]|nr:type II restriction endonuclease [Candidatus Omnitrophota bacterium]